MKKILLALMIVGLGMSCNKEPVPLTKQQVDRKIDSLVKAGKQESDEQARIDLDRRMKIEVKVKVDSILNARSQQGGKNITPNTKQ